MLVMRKVIEMKHPFGSLSLWLMTEVIVIFFASLVVLWLIERSGCKIIIAQISTEAFVLVLQAIVLPRILQYWKKRV